MKKFIIKILFYFIPFICIYGGYKFVCNNLSGDLGHIGQIPFGHHYNEYLQQNYLTDYLVKDMPVAYYEKVYTSKNLKLVTIGDSFSQQGVIGYQNYLAHILNDSIININKDNVNLQTAVSLLNSGLIDSSNCPILILEQVDRHLITGLCGIDFEMLYELPQNTENQQNESTNNKENKRNKSANKDAELYNLTSWIRLQCGYDNPVYKHNLKQDYFTHKFFSRKLYRYLNDFIFRYTKTEDIEKAKENLILLNQKFSEKGIKMIFMIASDKYDVYRPFMTDNSLPTDTTTDGLSNLPDVCVINTKWMLQEMVRNGEKDVYMVNDTHWSYKASKVVAEKLAKEIDLLQKR